MAAALSVTGPSFTTPVSSAASVPTFSEALNRAFGELQQAVESHDHERKPLYDYVETDARDLNGKPLMVFINDVYYKIEGKIRSESVTDRLVGIRAIDELMDSKVLGETAAKVSRFAKFLKEIFQNQTDRATLEAAAKVEGHVVRSGGALAADVVDNEVKRALELLATERLEARRYASLIVLQQMAENSPAIFNVHVRQFIDNIWYGLRDPKLFIREAAVVALRACLEVVEQRETRYRVQWYYRLFDETHKGLQRTTQIECVHGSLMALGELVQHTGEFMLARYREVVETVMHFRNSKEKHIRRAIIMLLPSLAAFAPERFARTYLQDATVHLVSVLRNPSERGVAFEALGEMATTLARVGAAQGMTAHLQAVSQQIRETIQLSKGRYKCTCPEALACVGIFAEALQDAWYPYAKQLLEPTILTGLSDNLVHSLQKVVRALPSLLSAVQTLLLDTISITLFAQPFDTTRSPQYVALFAQAIASGDVPPNTLIKVSLRTLSSIDFEKVPLLDFVYRITDFLDHADASVRKAAALACCSVLISQLNARKASTNGALLARPTNGQRNGQIQVVNGVGPGGFPSAVLKPVQQRLTDKIVHRLLMSAVADTSVAVRYPIMRALARTDMLDRHLVQADSLQCLFVALNDEDVGIRSLAIQLTGRLSLCNPAHIMPALRKHLMQLLSDIEHSADSKQREESAWLLGALIRAASRLVLPYISPINNALVGKLKPSPNGVNTAALVPGATGVQVIAGGGEDSVVAVVLHTLGELAAVAGSLLNPHLTEILPLVIDATQDNNSSQKRLTAVKTLGLVVESTGLVVVPYMEFPQLLGNLLRMLSAGDSNVRREVMKVLGVIGALDPHQHKLNQASLHGEGKLEQEGVRPQRSGKSHLHAPGQQHPGAGALITDGIADRAYGDDIHADLLATSGLGTSSDEYYPTVAINALMRVLRDPAAQSLHAKTVHSLFYIFHTMQVTCVNYLPKVMPVLFNVMRSAEDYLREFLCQQLTILVTYLRQHIRKYLPDLLAIVHEFWSLSNHLLPHLLRLVSELANALRDDFRQYIPDLLPKFIALFAEAERTSHYDMVKPALEALEGLGATLEDHLQLLLPVLMRLIGPGPSSGGEVTVSTPLAVRRAALHSAQQLLSRMQLSGYSSAILHPLLRVLDGPHDELRKDTLDTILALSMALGPDFAIFIPTIRKVLKRRRLTDERFNKVAALFMGGDPPCMSEADDWESSHAWLEDLIPPPTTPTLPAIADAHAIQRLPLNDNNLRRAWECSSRSTKEDWAEWMRHFSVELLKESPSPALRACHAIALAVPQMARELFAAGFVSCWSELEDGAQEQLVRSLEAALASPSIPPEIVTTLLNLAEFMEHDEKALPLDTRTLGALAEKCHAFAKALHYKELEYVTNPEGTYEALISINTQLRQPDAAQGAMDLAKCNGQQISETWKEKLGEWGKALDTYRATQMHTTDAAEYTVATLGMMRCLAALACWDEVLDLCIENWSRMEPHERRQIAPMGAASAWQMGEWEDMDMFVSALKQGDGGSASSNANFLSAVLAVHNKQYEQAQAHLESTTELLGTELAALVGESYDRAYADMVRVQQVRELQEVLDYCTAKERGDPELESRWALTRSMWRGRLRGLQNNVEVWQALLSVRRLVVPMRDDHWTWLKFASLYRKASPARPELADRLYIKLLGYDPMSLQPGTPGYGAGSGAPAVMYSYLKTQWAANKLAASQDNKNQEPKMPDPVAQKGILMRLQDLCSELPVLPPAAATPVKQTTPGMQLMPTTSGIRSVEHHVSLKGSPSTGASLLLSRTDKYEAPLAAKVNLRLCEWLWYTHKTEAGEQPVQAAQLNELLHHAEHATEAAPRWAKAWHAWGKFNAAAMQEYCHPHSARPDLAQAHVAPAIAGYFRSVSLSQTATGDRRPGGNLQDILRLLTLWFTWGHTSQEVEASLQEGFGLVCIDTWLVVIPQIIARIHTPIEPVKRLIKALLVRIGRHHPQALMYPLLVACKSQSPSRRAAAEAVMDEVRQQNSVLVEQAQLVSNELIRIAILWHELWHEALEEASRLYFGEMNVEGMLSTLLPLHEMMEQKGATTLKEIAFEQAYGRELKEAYEWCLKYKISKRETELHQAWDLYYHVFKRINKQLPSLTVLDLQYVSPALVKACGLELAVPGTYIVGEELVTIASFAPQLHVITSKQRPRKLTIHGSDGADYMFLLKGHEDLRQDERVMQLFGLVNGMLQADRECSERDLSIARYAVIPLSPNSGLIGWVPNTDTLHALIREYRDARKIPLNVEHRMMLGMAPDYDHLMVIQKIEVFEHAVDSTPGDDLHKVLWLKSRNSEVWLERRTSYTRSLAVMSMVGYLLGLGDRHPSNIMLDRYSGKILHIDFGDCFEASMHRDKFPEKVPFRLTRMLIKAMEVAGVQGTFSAVCKHTMEVLRREKESVMAMLEAFVHDPLINWRLLNVVETPTTPGPATHGPPQGFHGPPGPANAGGFADAVGAEVDNNAFEQVGLVDPGQLTAVNSPPRRETREQDLLHNNKAVLGANAAIESRAHSVIKRIEHKLAGTDFLDSEERGQHGEKVDVQVAKLIEAATSHYNLCQSYVGWCAFW